MSKCFFSFCIIVVFLFLAPAAGVAQERRGSSANAQLWVDLTLFNEYSNKVEFYGDGGYRRIFGADQLWNRLYIRPGIKYSPWRWLGLRAGAAFFYTDNTSLDNTLELRFWEGVSVGWPKFPRLRFSHYVRLEQRRIYNTDTWEEAYKSRFRYQLSSRFQPNYLKKSKYVYFPGFIEVFSNQTIRQSAQDLFANELRMGMGIGYNWNLYWSGQFSFIFQQSRNEVGSFKTSDLLFRFSLRHELVPQRDMRRLEN